MRLFRLSSRTSIRNLAIDFYGNNVLWTGDDGLELDYSHRNVRAFKNRITNANMGVSLQPTWGGPIYIFKNVFVNLARSPYKFNDEPSGFFVFNNTSIRTLADDGQGTFKNFTGYAWGHPGYQINGHRNYVSNFLFKDNLLVGLTGPARASLQIPIWLISITMAGRRTVSLYFTIRNPTPMFCIPTLPNYRTGPPMKQMV